MFSILLIHNSILLLLVLCGVLLLWRHESRHPLALAFLWINVLLFAGLGMALCFPVGPFAKIQLLAWAVFLHLPLLLAGLALVFHRRKRSLSIISLVLLIGIVAIGIDAFLIEPHWLKLTRVTISSDKVEQSFRIAVIADLQTDSPGDYELQALKRTMAERPDLILLAGDYLQTMGQEEYETEREHFRSLLREAALSAPLGVFAIGGNVDGAHWPELFEGLGVHCFETTSSVDLGPIVLTGLTLEDSYNAHLNVEGRNPFHIVLGHSPNFSLGRIEGDLLIAGHTHGGQCQLPGLGPLLTLSEVPRSWASGVTTIERGKPLVVPNGIGLERGHAPRIRFLCRPELAIVEVIPGLIPDPGS
jgi:predicted MPP superfamily phosphohydrolase